MRRLSRLRRVASVALILGCAQIGEPPGGPPDQVPPVLVGTHPDSTMVPPGFDDPAAFIFDEIVNEGSAPNFGLGSGDLEKLVLLSPSEEVPDVSWKRARITVKPREGWQPNRVYRIELLPGIADLRNNRSRMGRVITFSTGAPAPTRVLTGRVVDWTNGNPQANALVEAILQPDSLVYRTNADSSGRFRFGPLPDGSYLVAGVLDQNRNRKRDGRELFDTVRIAAGQDSVGEIWAFRHDTIPPRIQALAVNDSTSITATFNQSLDPYQRLPADSVTVRALPDSVEVAVTTILPKSAYDSVFRPAPVRDSAAAPGDSLAAPADSVAPADTTARVAPRRDQATPERQAADTTDRGPLRTKPILYDDLIIRLDSTLVPGGRYLVEIRGVRNASGVAGTTFQGLQVPARPVAPVDSAAADTTAPPAPPDSVRPPPPDTAQRSPPSRRR